MNIVIMHEMLSTGFKLFVFLYFWDFLNSSERLKFYMTQQYIAYLNYKCRSNTSTIENVYISKDKSSARVFTAIFYHFKMMHQPYPSLY